MFPTPLDLDCHVQNNIKKPSQNLHPLRKDLHSLSYVNENPYVFVYFHLFPTPFVMMFVVVCIKTSNDGLAWVL